MAIAGRINKKKHSPIFILIFFVETNKKYLVFVGSGIGRRILDDFGIKDYKYIQFKRPKALNDEKMIMLYDLMKTKHDLKIWQDLGKRCIECDKCSLVCPTCFCF